MRKIHAIPQNRRIFPGRLPAAEEFSKGSGCAGAAKELLSPPRHGLMLLDNGTTCSWDSSESSHNCPPSQARLA